MAIEVWQLVGYREAARSVCFGIQENPDTPVVGEMGCLLHCG